ncbi:hypothetical protein AWB75_06989 [Caballeronia catudaia]|uniref:Uncharacterized protein n=1 Tax=Caballeronia catudaia TaxID=1777136 RepID=A0A158DNH0_9BURK|nr:hypothetical protein AWB75_06989 [Caballeronia catudaia]
MTGRRVADLHQANARDGRARRNASRQAVVGHRPRQSCSDIRHIPRKPWRARVAARTSLDCPGPLRGRRLCRQKTCDMSRGLPEGSLRVVRRNFVDVSPGAEEVGHLAHAQAELFRVVATWKLKSDRRHGIGCGVVSGKNRTGSNQRVDPAVRNAARRGRRCACASRIYRAIFEANNDQIHGSGAVTLQLGG